MDIRIPHKEREFRTVSILIPVVRTENVKPLIRAIRENAGIPDNMYEILTLEDTEREGCPVTLHKLTQRARGEILCFLGDDTMPERNFLSAALMYMDNFPDGWGLVALNDGSLRPDTASHFCVHQKLLDHCEDGEIFHHSYKHCYGDNEISEIAQSLDRYAFAFEAKIKHNHPAQGTGEFDEHLQRAYSDANFRHDQQNFITRKIKRGGMHLGICLPESNEKGFNAFWYSFSKMLKPSYWSMFAPKLQRGDLADIIDVRNNLVRQALDWRCNCTHILMLDTDQTYPHDLIPRLMAHNLPFVGTVVHRRYPPFDPCVRVGDEFTEYVLPKDVYSGELIPVAATGFGAVLLQTPLLFDMEHAPGEWFRRDKKRPDGSPVGEDYEFCERMRERGHDVYVDTAPEIGHLSTVEINRDYHEVFKKIHGMT